MTGAIISSRPTTAITAATRPSSQLGTWSTNAHAGATRSAGQAILGTVTGTVREAQPATGDRAQLLHGGVGSGSRAGDFDAVYLVSQGEGKRPLVLIVETKGGSSTLGTRTVEGQVEQQGTSRYMLEIARLMSINPDLPAATRHAMGNVRLGNVDVRYVLVEAPIGTQAGQSVPRPGRISEFVITP